MIYQLTLKEIKGKERITLKASFALGVGQWNKRDFWPAKMALDDLIDDYFKIKGESDSIELEE